MSSKRRRDTTGPVGPDLEEDREPATAHAGSWLPESPEGQRLLLEAVPDHILVFDRTARIRYINRVAPGYDQDQVVGAPATTFLQEPDRPAFKQCFDAVLSTGEERELKLTDRQGRVYMTRLLPLREEGAIVSVVSVATDVTVFREVEAALRKSEEQFRLTFDLAPTGKTITGLDGRFVQVNRAFCKSVGYSAEELRRMTPLDVTHPQDRALVRRLNDRLLRGEIPDYRLEQRFVAKNARVVRALVACGLARDAMGAPLHFIGQMVDITERKRAEAALRRSEERLELALKGAALGMWDWNLQQDRVVTDERWAELLALPPERIEPTRRFWGERLHPDDRAAVLERVRSHLEGQTPLYESQHRLRREGDEWVWVLERGRVVERDDAGRPMRVAGTFLDITARKRAEEQRLDLEDRLRHAQKMEAVGRLAGGVAHDFNNLLTPILGYGELLQDGLRGRELPQLEEGAAEICKAGHRAQKLVQQLLAFGRKQVLEIQTLDLSEEIFQFERTIRRLIREDIRIRLRLEAKAGSVRADPAQVHQILLNLALNAQEAMSDGGTMTIATEVLAIEAEAQLEGPGDPPPGSYVVLTVEDTGQGMDPATQSRIFEPFFTTRGGEGGTGLGLATVYGIVRQHGGEIRVDSEPGRGTTFRIFLPRVDERPSAAAAPAPGVARTGRGETILVVEDEPLVRRWICDVLREHGYTVLDAGGPDDALRIARAHEKPIPLVLTDVILPVMNGRELFRQLQATHPASRALFVSGYSGDAISRHGVLEQDVDFLQKPFSAATLTARVREILDGAN